MRKLLLISLLLLLAQWASAGVLYVAPNGNDMADGSIRSPLKTISGARDRLRLQGRGKGAGETVFLRGGVYPVETEILFEPVDSGRIDAKVVYRSFPGERAVLDGCSYIHNWELFDSKRNIYRASVGGSKFRQLYVNGSLGNRARFPSPVPGDSYGPMFPISVKPPYLYVDEKYIGEFDVKDLSGNLEVVLFSHWYQQYLKVRYEGRKDGVVVFSVLDSADKFNKPVRFYEGSTFRFENSAAFIASPYDWFLDERTGFLYLAVPSGVKVSGLDVGYPAVNSLVVMRGSAESPVEDIELQSLDFQCSNWSFPSEKGVNFTQLAQPIGASRTFDAMDYPHGLIRIVHARRVALRDSVVKNSGGTGVQLFEDVDDSDLEGNKIFDIAGNGVEVDVPIHNNPSVTEQSSGVNMWNNELYRCGRTYTNGGGVLANNVRYFVFEHNDVSRMPYSCIQVCSHPLAGGKGVGCEANRLRFNRFHECMGLHDDGGAVYTLGGQGIGSVIAENYIYNIRRGRWAGNLPVESIYLDNHTNGLLIYGNVLDGGRVAELNKSFGNFILNNNSFDQSVVGRSGLLKGYVPER